MRRIRQALLSCALAHLLAAPAGAAPAPPPPGLPATEQVPVLSQPFNRGSQLVISQANPDVMYWIVDGLGVLKSTDRGLSWEPKNDGLPNLATLSLAIHPQDPDHLMVGFLGHFTAQGDRPYRSLDGGGRWEPTVVCEREDGLENLRQQCDAARVLFDPTAPSRFYLLVISQFDACGAFYRSCDLGASYDRNPRCLPPGGPRPPCSSADPEPVNNFGSNDGSILEVHPLTGDLLGTTGVHPLESALMTSRNKGGLWTYEDVADTTGSFVGSTDQGRTSLFIRALVLAPSDPDVRYASLEGSRCTDGKAHPVSFACPPPFAVVPQPPLVVRWFGEMSASVECSGSNDCDGDPFPDRLWRPLFDVQASSPGSGAQALLVDPTDPDRLFAAVTGSVSASNELLMLTPASESDPTATPWRKRLIHTGFGSPASLVRDPGDPGAFFLVDRTSIRRFASDDGWQSWQASTTADLGGVHHVYDLLETRGSDGPRIVAATTTAIWVADELGLGWTTSDAFAMQAASRPAVAPSDPDRVYAKRTWALTIGTGGFDEMTEMDNVSARRSVMCTNVFHQVAVDPDDPSVVYAATGAGIWSHPYARVPADPAEVDTISREWVALARSADGLDDEYIWSLAFDLDDPGHNRILAGSRSGAIFESLDRGLSWLPSPMSLPASVTNQLRDVRDIRLVGPRGYAATGAGILAREEPSAPWRASLTGDRMSRIAPGATGASRLYAAGEAGLYRSRDSGGSWEPLDLVPAPPYGAVLETKSRDGRHHLWVPDFSAGLFRISTTMTARPGSSPQQIVLDWQASPGGPPVTGYELHYGFDPDLFSGAGAAEGSSPIHLGPVTTATLTGLDLSSGPLYVALKGEDNGGQPGPIGLPLQVDPGYVFSPAIEASDAGSCPPAMLLEWDPVPGAAGYRVYRSAGSPGGPFEAIATLEAPATSFEDAGVSPGAVFAYFMTTLSAGSETTGGNIAQAQVIDDSDLDEISNCSDNCPAEWNPLQDDGDTDGRGDLCDCAPLDPAAFTAPSDIAGLDLAPDASTLTWAPSATGSGTLYDVVRGSLSQLPVGTGPSEACLESGSSDAMALDPEIPPPGSGHYYIVRARNGCGTGTYGFQAGAAERASPACP